MKFFRALGAFFLTLLLLAGGLLVYVRVTGGSLTDPFSPPAPDAEALLSGLPLPDVPEAFTADGQALRAAWLRERSAAAAGPCVQEKRSAVLPVRVTLTDPERLAEELTASLRAAMEEKVLAASRADEIYENGAYRPELLRSVLSGLLADRLSAGDLPLRESEAELRLRFTNGGWIVEDPEPLAQALRNGEEDADAAAERLFEAAAAALPVIPLHYTIDENALAGPAPDPANFGVTDDPAVIEALLQRTEAQALTAGQALCWNAQIERFPNSSIGYYLDETILVLVWQEVEARAVGTFSEVFIADGSQLRRKIAGDTPFDLHFETCSQFARDTNAVLAVGGDFYHHGRACGVSVYQREICRFEPNTCDVCYITADGDLLFSYRGQFTSEDEARRFIADNDVLFSLAFGPVLIDGGADVTPTSYVWGEIDDTYARSALGLLGPRHYLTMNINCGQGQYYDLTTLRQAADAMIRRGCVKAYTLDGGQTATTVFNGQLVNPVQFGWEKEISDVIYFATALPEG